MKNFRKIRGGVKISPTSGKNTKESMKNSPIFHVFEGGYENFALFSRGSENFSKF